MSNTKFTTGPWKAVIHNHKEHEVTNDSGQMSVAKVYIYDAEEQTLANAKLIAASPTMYDYILSKSDAGDKQAKQIINSIEYFD